MFHLFFRGCQWFALYSFKGPHLIAIKVFLQFSEGFPGVDIILHHPVFERVVAQYYQSSAFFNHIATLVQKIFKSLHLLINFDAKRLKHLGEVLVLPSPGSNVFQ